MIWIAKAGQSMLVDPGTLRYWQALGWGIDADANGVVDSSGTSGSGTSITENTQSGTTYTLVLADAGTVVATTNAAAVTLTVPPNSSVAFPIGSWLEVFQQGAGQVTVTAGAGVTFDSPGSLVKTAMRYSSVRLRKRGTDEWVLSGDLA